MSGEGLTIGVQKGGSGRRAGQITQAASVLEKGKATKDKAIAKKEPKETDMGSGVFGGKQ